jgi:glucokinase
LPADGASGVARHAPRVVGIDVGGTKVCAATLRGGALSEPVRTPTDVSCADALVDQLERAIRAQGRCDAVGVAVPCVVDHQRGETRFGVNVPLAGVPLRAVLGERLGVPVVVDNDATAAAMAEAYDDELRPLAAVTLIVTVGTGIGGGIVIDGRPFRGATGAAGEFGHLLVGAELADGAPPEQQTFPRLDSLEHAAAGSALDRLAAARGLPRGAALVAAARRGEPAARDALRIAGERLGVGIANLINVFDPDLVLVGGGVSAAGELLLGPAREAARRFVVPGVGTRTRIELARHGEQAGVRGAALLAREALGGAVAQRELAGAGAA